MNITPLPSSLALSASIRTGQSDLHGYISELQRRFEKVEPGILSFRAEASRFDRLRREAEALQSRYPDPGSRPPLYGIPIGVKDIFHVDGFTTHAGSRIPEDHLQGEEAAVVTALKAAGALILGKTVTTEFAYFAPGPTRNPHNTAHTPGGSSSGSAAAVAAGLCPLALGTQTIGSITRPASFCGVVGFKPSYERISRAGVIPLSPSLDHVGVFAPDVGGVALTAAVACRDWNPGNPIKSGNGFPVLGVPEGPYLEAASSLANHHFRNVCQRLIGKRYDLQFIPAMLEFEAIRRRHNKIVAAEAARVHAAWYEAFSELYHPKTAELIERGRGISDAELADALTGREALRAEFEALMDSRGVDLWISPAAPGPAPRGLESTGDPVMNLPWTHSGLPTLGLPAGAASSGLPMGVQLAARPGADEALLAWGEILEPDLLPSEER